MKAKNKFWENFVVECGAVIPKEYQTEPKGHDKYTWTSQNGQVFKVAEIEDTHLANIYVMLTKSLAYHEDLEELTELSGEPQGEMAQDMYFSGLDNLFGQICFIRNQLRHIGYEVHKRKLFINHFNISENVASGS